MEEYSRLPDMFRDSQFKVVGGTDAIPHEFPYQVNIEYNPPLSSEYIHMCGGVIINTLFILTAAHCFKDDKGSTHNLNRIRIVAGDHNQYEVDDAEQIREVAYLFSHGDFNSITLANDIGILVLSQPLEFNNNVKNISYPYKPTKFRGSATVTGWGKLKEGQTSPVADILQKATVPIVSKSECRRNYSRVNMTVIESMMCAGSADKDSCQGDSGGPLTCTVVGSSGPVLCGIVSFGKGCGRSSYPGVYTDVSHFSEWIDRTAHFYSTMKGKCKKNRFYCQEDKTCISRASLCNGIMDCSQGSDELTCSDEHKGSTGSTSQRPISVPSGTEAGSPTEFPYQVNIRYIDSPGELQKKTFTYLSEDRGGGGGLLCRGTILDKLRILTTADCFVGKRDRLRLNGLTVVAGDPRLYVDEPTEQIRNVSDLFQHAGYKAGELDNDIAILVLSSPLQFNNAVKSIPYPKDPTEFTSQGIVATGFRSGYYLAMGSSWVSDLKKLVLPIVPRSECQTKYDARFANVTESVMCVGGEKGKDATVCIADRGAPLVCKVAESNETVLCGVSIQVSTHWACTYGGFAGIYTNVSHFFTWIDNIVTSTNFRCSNGNFVELGNVCDRNDDCGDNSDEDKCDMGPCDDTKFTCKVDGRCIEKSWECDEIVDCEDASDEADCHYHLR